MRGSDLRTSQFLGSRYNDTFVTGEGNSHIVNTMKGDDLVVGGGGNEYIRAGGNSYIQPDAKGKTGNGATVSGGSTEYLRAGGNSYIQSDVEGKTGDDDTVSGGGNTDLIAGGGGNDTLWADKRDSEAYKTPVRFNEDDWRGDWISGEYNNDTIHGSNREDLLFGGEGNDTVSGGAASDIILGDGSYFPSVRSRVNEGQEINIATGETYSFGVPVPLPINFNWEKAAATPSRKKKGRTWILVTGASCCNRVSGCMTHMNRPLLVAATTTPLMAARAMTG